MQKTFYLILFFAVISGCKDKIITCEDIGQNIKSWSVYDPNDSISMHDQFGNNLVFKITKYQNDPAYQMRERRTFLKKMAVCKGFLSLSNDTDYFKIFIESSSGEHNEYRKPDYFDFKITLGDMNTSFAVSDQDTSQTVYSSDGFSTIEYNYTSGNIIYGEAIVSLLDTTTSNNSVYKLVYVKEKGLVEFSTRNPARTYVLD